MKIAFVSSGNSIHVKKLANGLIREGHQVSLYTLPNHKNLLEDFDSRVKIVKLKFGGKIGYYLNALELKKHIEKESYDIINCHYVSGYGTLVRLARLNDVVASVFGSDVYSFPFKSKRNMKIIIKNLNYAKLITSTSYVMAEKVKEFYGSNREIRVTHFGVNLNLFKPFKAKVKIQDRDAESFVFGAIKKMSDIYGIEVLINAFSILINNEKYAKKDIKLFLFGTGIHLDKYKELTKKLGLENKIIFKGYIPNYEVPEALESIDVVCLPSLNESFGVAAVEAMACGKPLIVSDAPGFLEVIEPDVTGIVVEKGDAFKLSLVMEQMYNMSYSERSKYGIEGRKRAEKLFNFDNNIKVYLESISKI